MVGRSRKYWRCLFKLAICCTALTIYGCDSWNDSSNFTPNKADAQPVLDSKDLPRLADDFPIDVVSGGELVESSRAENQRWNAWWATINYPIGNDAQPLVDHFDEALHPAAKNNSGHTGNVRFISGPKMRSDSGCRQDEISWICTIEISDMSIVRNEDTGEILTPVNVSCVKRK